MYLLSPGGHVAQRGLQTSFTLPGVRSSLGVGVRSSLASGWVYMYRAAPPRPAGGCRDGFWTRSQEVSEVTDPSRAHIQWSGEGAWPGLAGQLVLPATASINGHIARNDPPLPPGAEYGAAEAASERDGQSN